MDKKQISACCERSTLNRLHLHRPNIRTQFKSDYLQMWSDRPDRDTFRPNIHPLCEQGFVHTLNLAR